MPGFNSIQARNLHYPRLERTVHSVEDVNIELKKGLKEWWSSLWDIAGWSLSRSYLAYACSSQ